MEGWLLASNLWLISSLICQERNVQLQLSLKVSSLGVVHKILLSFEARYLCLFCGLARRSGPTSQEQGTWGCLCLSWVFLSWLSWGEHN
ncbi:hypothetical protein BDY19DRAFT_547630 [Irpex rosettiformis]|uniref:Uncharacterized protein n=1 Tax=Irpex rosettiformis TaxID=378272 RepID=A0ACB8TQR1_9APHY|nr:hypothetical protein BDY19DRAFT_547630 [Irpex rosettiformis]